MPETHVYFVESDDSTSCELSAADQFDGLRKLEKHLKSRSGVFWGVHASGATARFSNWQAFGTAVDGAEAHAKRMKTATTLFQVFVGYVESLSELQKLRVRVAEHPDNEELKVKLGELEATLDNMSTGSAEQASMLQQLPILISSLGREGKQWTDVLKNFQSIYDWWTGNEKSKK